MSDQGSAALSSDDFRSIMGHFASGVTVITADDEGTPVGTTASAFTSLSLDPPMLLVCLNKQSHTGEVVHRTRRFAVNILGEESPDLALRFARKGGDKFDGTRWHPGRDRLPVLDDALASVECTVVEETAGGTHFVFIAAADAATLRAGAPLAYYRGRFGRLETDNDIHAVRLLQQSILARANPVGTALDVGALADELGLPRGTTYHALAKLREQGLVYRDDDGTFRVASPSERMVVEALEARRTIEIGVISSLLGTLDDAQLHTLRAAAEATQADDGGPRRSEHAWAQANHAFHEAVVGMTGNGSLMNVYRQFNITSIIGRVQDDFEDVDRRDFTAGGEHLALVDALEHGDRDAAIQAVAHHTEAAIEDAHELFERKPSVQPH